MNYSSLLFYYTEFFCMECVFNDIVFIIFCKGLLVMIHKGIIFYVIKIVVYRKIVLQNGKIKPSKPKASIT